MDAAAVTALRTAAAGVLAADTLCRTGASSYAVVGCGVNGAETARMLVAHGATPLVWDVDASVAELVAERLGARVARVSPEALALRGRDHGHPGRTRSCSRTGSLADGQHVSLMGADGPGKAEVAIGGARRARTLFCDEWEQASHGGELAAGVAAGVVTRERRDRARSVLTGEAEGRAQRAEITLFDSTGLAIQDLAIARAALLRSVELDLPRIEL